MCGVFGYISDDGRETVDMERLRRIAATTSRRGRHAWGMAWLDADGRLHMFKQQGDVVDALGLLTLARNAVALIGHCRFTTQGHERNNSNNHPHPVDGGWFVHNGVVRGFRRIYETLGTRPISECDTEALGHVMAATGGSRADQAWAAADAVGESAPFAMLGLWRGELVALADGNPLHVGEDGQTTWFGSLAQSLPGRPVNVQSEALIYETGA